MTFDDFPHGNFDFAFPIAFLRLPRAQRSSSRRATTSGSRGRSRLWPRIAPGSILKLGEAANIAKKLNRVRDGIPSNTGNTEEELRAAFRKEVADAFIYLDLVAQSEGFMLGAAVQEKFNETSRKIGFPIECSS